MSLQTLDRDSLKSELSAPGSRASSAALPPISLTPEQLKQAIEDLSSTNDNRFESAARTLGRSQSPQGANALLKALEKATTSRSEVIIQSLSTVNSPAVLRNRVFTSLSTLLSQVDAPLRTDDYLEGGLRHRRIELSAAVGRMASANELQSIVRPSQLSAESAFQVLLASRDASADSLIHKIALRTTPPPTMNALAVLARANHPETIPALKHQRGAAFDYNNSFGDWLTTAALIDPSFAVKEAVRTTDVSPVGANEISDALSFLRQSKHPDAASALDRIMKNPSDKVKIPLIQNCDLGDATLTPEFVKDALRSLTPEVRAAMLTKLARENSPEWDQAALALLKDGDPKVRRAVASSATGYDEKDPTVRTTILETLAKDPEPKIRSLVAGRLSEYRDEDFAKVALNRMLTDSDLATSLVAHWILRTEKPAEFKRVFAKAQLSRDPLVREIFLEIKEELKTESKPGSSSRSENVSGEPEMLNSLKFPTLPSAPTVDQPIGSMSTSEAAAPTRLDQLRSMPSSDSKFWDHALKVISGDQDERLAGLQVLRDKLTASDVPKVREWLMSDNFRTRSSAAMLLGAMGDKESVPRLREILRNAADGDGDAGSAAAALVLLNDSQSDLQARALLNRMVTRVGNSAPVFMAAELAKDPKLTGILVSRMSDTEVDRNKCMDTLERIFDADKKSGSFANFAANAIRTIPGSESAKVAETYRSAEQFGLERVERYSLDLLKYLVSNHQALDGQNPEQLAALRNGKVAVVAVGRDDYNGAFRSTGNRIAELKKAGYQIIALEAGTQDELASGMKRIIDAGVKAEIFVLGGHGSQRSLALGNGTASEREITPADIDDFKRKGLGALLKPGGEMLLFSCSTGSGRASEQNLGNAFRALFPQARRNGIIAPVGPSNISHLSVGPRGLQVEWSSVSAIIGDEFTSRSEM